MSHGLSGLMQAAQAVGLQNHKGVLDRWLKQVDLANIIGTKAQGYDSAEIAKELFPEDDDVDNSVTVAGDTHVHIQPQNQPQINQPSPGLPSSPRLVPAWLPWVLAAALGASGTYLFSRDNTNIIAGPDETERTIISLSKGDD